MGEKPASVHVIQHPHFDQLDFELRTLLEHQRRNPGADTILSFFDRAGHPIHQVVLVYRPSESLLKRLILPGEAGSRDNSRLEVWRDMDPETLAQTVESAFLEKTRPFPTQPDVFLGDLEDFIRRGDF